MFKKKRVALWVIGVLLCLNNSLLVSAQNNEESKSIGTTKSDSSAILNISSNGEELLLPRMTQGSVGIGTVNPNSSAILDLSSNNKGLLLPRMTLHQRGAIKNPAEGLIVYQTDFLNGLYIYNSDGWSQISSPEAQLVTNAAPWNTAGNNDADSSSFLGTLNNVSLIFKVNNEFAGLLDNKRGNTFLGYKTGWATESFNSVVLGAYALQRASIGNDNVVIGYQSMFSHENGQYNVALGSLSLSSSTVGDKNTALGAMAGYRSRGNSNVFLGFQAGYFEQGNDKLYISNNASTIPLIYGDFKAKLVGINTSAPANKLSIKGDKDGDSGLQLQSMTITSPAQPSNGIALSVDELGNVILVKNSTNSVTGPVSEFWNNRENGIQNTNNSDVFLTKNLQVSETISSNRFEVADGGIVFKKINARTTPSAANGKALSLDNFGNVILVKSGNDSVTVTEPVSEFWSNRGNGIQNKSNSDVFLTKNLQVSETISSNRFEVADGGIVFKKINARTTPLAANGKALSLDNFGNVILVENTPTTNVGEWLSAGTDLTNKNTGKVIIKKDLDVTSAVTANDLTIKKGKIKFDNLSSRSTASISNGKVLTLDTNGNIILANDGVGNTDPSHWKKTGSRVELKETGQVVIGEGITKLPTNFNLFVSKGILAERVRVAVPNSEKWADYVFKPDYRLMPLYEVEHFINTFGHLPNMISATTAAKEGMDVLEMSVKLLEKVEELTIYAIEANKRIENLEKQLNELRK